MNLKNTWAYSPAQQLFVALLLLFLLNILQLYKNTKIIARLLLMSVYNERYRVIKPDAYQNSNADT